MCECYEDLFLAPKGTLEVQMCKCLSVCGIHPWVILGPPGVILGRPEFILGHPEINLDRASGVWHWALSLTNIGLRAPSCILIVRCWLWTSCPWWRGHGSGGVTGSETHSTSDITGGMGVKDNFKGYMLVTYYLLYLEVIISQSHFSV